MSHSCTLLQSNFFPACTTKELTIPDCPGNSLTLKRAVTVLGSVGFVVPACVVSWQQSVLLSFLQSSNFPEVMVVVAALLHSLESYKSSFVLFAESVIFISLCC